MLGKVKWFNEEKGFGFIDGDDGKSYFCHYSSIEMLGHKILFEDQPVQFEPGENEKGLFAKNIIVQK